MSQFFCNRIGGITGNDDELIVLEGTKELGPWYNTDQFTDAQINRWLSRGWIALMEKEVK